MEISAEIDDQQPITFRFIEITQYEGVIAQHGAIELASLRGPQHGVLAAKMNEITMQGIRLRVLLAFRKIELAPLECGRFFRID